jgi:hypothetical protein
MFKKWFDRDLPAAKAYDAANLKEAAIGDGPQALRVVCCKNSALDELIARLAAALKPGPAKAERALETQSQGKQVLRSI